MKPERALTAERVAAQHCPELLRAGPSPDELLPRLAQAGELLARELGPAFAPMLGGKQPTVSASAARASDMLEMELTIATLAANCLFAAGAKGTPILASLDAGAVLSIVDRAFGGSGKRPKLLPHAFPFSADLMIAKLEALIGSMLGKALGIRGDDGIRLQRRDGSFEKMAPFAGDCRLAVVKIDVTEQDGESFALTLALPMDRLPELFGQAAHSPAARLAGTTANPANEPFGDVSLSLTAVVVDMQVPMSTIANLEPGQVLPITVARNVPLRIGDKTIAHGTIGALDEQVAVQITRAF